MKYSDEIFPPDQEKIKSGIDNVFPPLKLPDTDSDSELADICKLAAYVCDLNKVTICLFEEYKGQIRYTYDINIKDRPGSLKLVKWVIEQNRDLLEIQDIHDVDKFAAMVSDGSIVQKSKLVRFRARGAGQENTGFISFG